MTFGEQDAPLAGVAAIHTHNRGAASEYPPAITSKRYHWCGKYLRDLDFDLLYFVFLSVSVSSYVI